MTTKRKKKRGNGRPARPEGGTSVWINPEQSRALDELVPVRQQTRVVIVQIALAEWLKAPTPVAT